MSMIVRGNRTTYGHRVGILMSDSRVPRIPGDPGHAETFDFPVAYAVLENFPFQDLVDIRKDHISILIDKSLELQAQGVHLIVADCGLFAPFQPEMKDALSVPFIGSALDVIPLLTRFLPTNSTIGVLTGDTRILSDRHLQASGINPTDVSLSGMEESEEFRKVVIDHHPELDIEKLRQDVRTAAERFLNIDLKAVVIECTNLISFRSDIQEILGIPVYDLVSLIEHYISGFQVRRFTSAFIADN